MRWFGSTFKIFILNSLNNILMNCIIVCLMLFFILGKNEEILTKNCFFTLLKAKKHLAEFVFHRIVFIFTKRKRETRWSRTDAFFAHCTTAKSGEEKCVCHSAGVGGKNTLLPCVGVNLVSWFLTHSKKKATRESEKHAWNVARWIQAIYLTMCQHEKVIKIEDFFILLRVGSNALLTVEWWVNIIISPICTSENTCITQRHENAII